MITPRPPRDGLGPGYDEYKLRSPEDEEQRLQKPRPQRKYSDNEGQVPARKQHTAELVRVTVEVNRVDDPAKARRLAELLADLLDAPTPDERRAK